MGFNRDVMDHTKQKKWKREHLLTFNIHFFDFCYLVSSVSG